MQGRSSSYFSTWNNLRSHWYGWWLAVVFTDSMLKIVTVLRHFIMSEVFRDRNCDRSYYVLYLS